MPAPRQTKVKVYLRSRPCENFANDMIEYGADGKVTKNVNAYCQMFIVDLLEVILIVKKRRSFLRNLMNIQQNGIYFENIIMTRKVYPYYYKTVLILFLKRFPRCSSSNRPPPFLTLIDSFERFRKER